MFNRIRSWLQSTLRGAKQINALRIINDQLLAENSTIKMQLQAQEHESDEFHSKIIELEGALTTLTDWNDCCTRLMSETQLENARAQFHAAEYYDEAYRRGEIDPKIEFTLPNGVRLVAEHNEDESWESIDIVARSPNGRYETVCCADFDKGDDDCEARGLRVFSFNGVDEEYCHEVSHFDFAYLLGENEVDPQTEHDYIDEVIQAEVDRFDMRRVAACKSQEPLEPHMRLLHPVRHSKVYKLACAA